MLLGACGNRSSPSRPPRDADATTPAQDAAAARRWPGPCTEVERRDGKPDETLVYRYDDDGRLAGWSYEDDIGLNLDTRTYNADGLLVEERRVDKLSAQIWRTTYDDRGHPIAVTQELIVPDAPFESGLGPEVDLVIERHRARTEPPKQVWSAEWDAAGHLAVEHLNLGEIVRWTYDASGRVVKRDYDDTKGGGSLITWTYRASGACRPMPHFLYTMQGGEWQTKPLVDDYCPETERRTSRDGATLMGEERREYNDAGDLLRIEEIHHDLDNLRTGQLFTYDIAGNLLTKFWLRDGSVVPHATYDYGCWPR